MIPGTSTIWGEWCFFINNLWYKVCVFVIRWTMPIGIREACCYGEIHYLERSFPAREYWEDNDFANFEYGKALLEKEFGVILSEVDETVRVAVQ